MFLLNMFSRSSANTEEMKYDKITFKIDLHDNVPQYLEWDESMRPESEEELTEDNPLYYEIFPKLEKKYIEYAVNQNDTLQGLAIKLDINESVLKQLNDLSGNLYPGMTIKLPEGTDLAKLQDEPNQQLAKLRISQLLSHSQAPNEANFKYTVSYYAGLSGYIHGVITINPSYIIFNPLLEGENITRFSVERLLKFNAIVQTVDIQEVTFMEIPEMEDLEEPKMISVVQFMLYKVGNIKIQKKYKERLKQLKLDHKAIASMSFAIVGGREIGELLVKNVQQILKSNQGKQEEQIQEKNRLTNIPFFDIIHENIQPKQELSQTEEKREVSNIIKPTAILGNLSEPSSILSREEFTSLVLSFPMIYQLNNWSKVYSSTRDGTSFNTLLNKSRNIEPALLLIKQYKGYKFGAFLIENLETGKTGRGEMFIFTYKEDNIIPEVYTWTTKNQLFVVTEKDFGIGIGMGFKYGIFVKNTLDKGSSASTKTFGNEEMLSKKEDFLVDQIQIWGLDSEY